MKPAEPAKRRLLGWLIGLVLVAFAVFLALILPAVARATAAARRGLAETDAGTLEGGMEAYRNVLGRYPGGTAAQILSALRGENTSSNAFVVVSPRRVNAAGEYTDPWRTPYRITFDAAGKPHVYSFGPNRQDDQGRPGSDDITLADPALVGRSNP
ncbi:MAG TPA: type II secretion system protein GspG [Candidatus Limnocylindria bacterium]|nr:type II secretion system protein GspG [Candidatus Limnocylindria bacterium]